jgi:L-iditol 2-dehydrogenase
VAGPPPGTLVLVVAPPSRSQGFAQYMAVDPRYLIPLPADSPPDGLVLAQQLGTVIHSCRRLNGVLGLDVVILGQGSAGLLFTRLISAMGANRVIGVDVVPSRLRVARSLGATATFNPEAEEVGVLDAVRELTAGRLADLVIEAVGKTETVNQALDLVKERGQLLFYGVPERGRIPIDFSTFFRKRAMAIANVGAQAEPGLRSFRLALNMIGDGRIDVSQFITHCLALTQMQAAYELADARHDVVKVLIEF